MESKIDNTSATPPKKNNALADALISLRNDNKESQRDTRFCFNQMAASINASISRMNARIEALEQKIDAHQTAGATHTPTGGSTGGSTAGPTIDALANEVKNIAESVRQIQSQSDQISLIQTQMAQIQTQNTYIMQCVRPKPAPKPKPTAADLAANRAARQAKIAEDKKASDERQTQCSEIVVKGKSQNRCTATVFLKSTKCKRHGIDALMPDAQQRDPAFYNYIQKYIKMSVDDIHKNRSDCRELIVWFKMNYEKVKNHVDPSPKQRIIIDTYNRMVASQFISKYEQSKKIRTPRPRISPVASPVGSPVALCVASPVASPVGSPVASPVAQPVVSSVADDEKPPQLEPEFPYNVVKNGRVIADEEVEDIDNMPLEDGVTEQDIQYIKKYNKTHPMAPKYKSAAILVTIGPNTNAYAWVPQNYKTDNTVNQTHDAYGYTGIVDIPQYSVKKLRYSIDEIAYDNIPRYSYTNSYEYELGHSHRIRIACNFNIARADISGLIQKLCEHSYKVGLVQNHYIRTMPTVHSMDSYMFNFFHHKNFPIPNELPNKYILDAPVERWNRNITNVVPHIHYEIRENQKEYSVSLKRLELTYFDTLDGEIMRMPPSNDTLDMIYEQTAKYKCINMGLILHIGNGYERYTQLKPTQRLHHPLGFYRRRYLNMCRVGLEKLKVHGSGSAVYKELVRARKHNSTLNLKYEFDQKIRDVHFLKYHPYGVFYDPITTYVYYPTKHGVVCIGVAAVEILDKRTIDPATHQVHIEENVSVSQGCHIGMLNRYEVMHVASDNRNYLDPDSGTIVWYNKCDPETGTISYNANYYTAECHDFKAQSMPPCPIDPTLEIPLDLYTTRECCGIMRDDEPAENSLNPDPVIHWSTGTGVFKAIRFTNDDYDQYASALQYLKVPNCFYSLGQFRKTDDPNQLKMHLIKRIGHGDNFNDHLFHKDRKKIPVEEYSANSCMITTVGLAGDAITNEILDDLIKDTQHITMVDQRDTGCILDPATKCVITIKCGTNIAIGTLIQCRAKIQDEYKSDCLTLVRNHRIYALSSEETSMCRARCMNYLDPQTNKVVYYSYMDVARGRLIYNLNYFVNPTGCIIPCYQPPTSM